MSENTGAGGLTVTTVRFGAPEEVTVRPSDLYAFPEALPGLPDSHRYALIVDNAYAPLRWLQSLDETAVCLPLLELAALRLAGYAERVAATLGDDALEALLVLRLDPEAGLFSANLLAPIVLDPRGATGTQIVLDGGDYAIRQHIVWDAAARRFDVPC